MLYGNAEKIFQRLGERIKTLRLKQGLTQEKVSEIGDFGFRFYQRIEAGKPIHMKTVLRLCDTFKISLAELFKGL